MPYTGGSLRRDPLSVRYDSWARGFLEVLKADPWNWHGRTITTPRGDELLGEDRGGLTIHERAAQRSLWWCLGHAASSGLRTRPDWSLQASWGPPAYPEAGPGRIFRTRHRLLTARVTPKSAGRRSVLVRGRPSYIANPTSRGARDGENWQPRG
jgi:hypothetical protein